MSEEAKIKRVQLYGFDAIVIPPEARKRYMTGRTLMAEIQGLLEGNEVLGEYFYSPDGEDTDYIRIERGA